MTAASAQKKMASKTDDKDEGENAKSTRRISKDEAAFILGAQGKTKAKLANVSGTTIDLIEIKGLNQLEISGPAKNRARAMKYIDYVIAQRSGPVRIAEAAHPDDLTILAVPADTVSFITGTKGAYLRFVEDEWWTLLFFLGLNPKNPIVHPDPKHTERLAIFGPHRQRRGAELKVMAAIENKTPGYYTKNSTEVTSPNEEFDTDTTLIPNDDYSYALGKNGNTRKKLARASSCIVEYIGRMAYLSGTKKEREHAKEYLAWLLHQRVGEYTHVNHKGRDDVTMIMVQRNCIAYVTGTRGMALRQIEEETSTFCFIETADDDCDDGQKQLLIFGYSEDRRFAESLVWERISTCPPGELQDGGKDGRKGKGRGKGDSSKGKAQKSGHSNVYASHFMPDPERPVGKDVTTDFQTISDEDAAFIMGQGGKTKRKIGTVSGAYLELKAGRLEITGKEEDRKRALQYVKIVMKQRLGPVKLEDIEPGTDMSVIEVPCEAVSFVTGKGGAFLRMVEDEFGTLLFFLDYNKSRSYTPSETGQAKRIERLAICGPERMRRGAELKVMAAIEMKQANYFTSRDANMPLQDPLDGFRTDRLLIAEEDYSYALGKGGSTRKKLAKASNCIIEYIGRHAYLSGTKPERLRAREYLQWLARQRVGPVEVNYANRTDVTNLPVPKDCVGFVTGHKGTSLRAVEDQTGTFCFIEGGRDDPYRDPKPLLIFGLPENRKSAEGLLRQRIEQKLETGWVHEDYGGGGYGNGGYADGKGDRRHGGKGERKTKGGGKGGKDSKDLPSWHSDRDRWPAASYGPSPADGFHNGGARTMDDATQQASSHAPAAPVEEVKEEDDEAWGDWGASDDDEDAAPPIPTKLLSEMALSPQTRTPAGAATWSEQPVPQNFKAERLKGEQELQLPPQLVNEAAWPELGGMGKASAKRGAKKR